MATRQAYKATIELAFDYNGTRERIPPEKIIYIMIEHDYQNRNLPIIYVSMSVNGDLYTKITKYKETAKFYLNINKQNINSRSSISRNRISGTFSYLASNTNPNYTDTLNDINNDNSYQRIMIGLVDIELTNYLRKSFNGIYRNASQSTLVALALEGSKKAVIEPLTYDKSYDQLLVNPITSREKMLQFIFDEDPFYDTRYRFFVDFDYVYLLSKRGNAISAGNGDLENIIVDIKSVTADESYYEGIEIKNGSYYVYINPINSNVTLNEGTEKVANQIIAIDDDTSLQTLNLEINSTIDSSTKQTFVRTGNAALLKNELETNSVNIEIVKQNIDGSTFTPNKSIMVSNYGDYAKYNGKYIMSYKREFYKAVAGEFIVSCNVGLSKVGNIERAYNTSNKSNSNSLASSKSANKKSTAHLKSSANISYR